MLALAAVFLRFGCLKFTAYEESGGAKFLGVFKILTGLLIAARLVSPRLSVIGGAMGAFTFFITLTLMLSTPGLIQSGFSGPFALSAVPGQFLLRDLVSFAACLWLLGVSLAEAGARRRI